MTLDELIVRSKNDDKIDLGKISCSEQTDSLVKLVKSRTIKLEPIWEVDFKDLEGSLYKTFIKNHLDYNGIFVRSAVAKRLLIAAENFPKGYKLVVRAGHRPVEVQNRLLRELRRHYLDKNPAATDHEALEHARTYVSDPTLKLPPHCCGAAVDVDVFDTGGQRYVDFGSSMNTDSVVSFLHSKLINKEQNDNRMMLLKAMLLAGFASNPREWWHFSYGDQNWAHFYRKNKCLYGIIEPMNYNEVKEYE